MYAWPSVQKWINKQQFFRMTWLFNNLSSTILKLHRKNLPRDATKPWPKTNTERLCIDYTFMAVWVSTWHSPGTYARCSDSWQCVTKPCEFAVNISLDFNKHVQEKKSCNCLNKSQLTSLDYRWFFWGGCPVSVPVDLLWGTQGAAIYTEIGLWLDVWIINYEIGKWMRNDFGLPLNNPHYRR